MPRQLQSITVGCDIDLVIGSDAYDVMSTTHCNNVVQQINTIVPFLIKVEFFRSETLKNSACHDGFNLSLY